MLKKHTQKNKIKTLKKQNKIIKHYPMTDWLIVIQGYMIDSDWRPLLKLASTDVIISNHGPILGYSQNGILSKLSYL
jgi:hypothetical protein